MPSCDDCRVGIRRGWISAHEPALRWSGTGFSQALLGEGAVAVDEVAGGHALLAFELQFERLESGGFAATDQEQAVRDRKFAWAQVFGGRLGRNDLHGPEVKALPAKSGEGAGP